jgi:hypothetical protein
MYPSYQIPVVTLAIEKWRVSKRVSKPGNTDDATLIEPVELRSTVSEPQGNLLLH